MLILAIILFGMLTGAAAQLILGRQGSGIDWTMAIVSGLIVRRRLDRLDLVAVLKTRE
jgi:hypothetical protein